MTAALSHPAARCLASARAAALLTLGLLAVTAPAQAAPYTLRIDGLFTPTSSPGTVANGFAEQVWGGGTWNNGRSADVHLEVDFDDALTVTPFNATQAFFAYEDVLALRVTLGGVSLATTGLTAGSKIDLALSDLASPPSVLDGDGFALLIGQNAPRTGSVYSLPGATTALSSNGLYRYAFNSVSDLSSPTVLEFRAYNAATMTLAGASPTGRMVTTGWSVVPLVGGEPPPEGTLPEPGSLLLAGAALTALAAARRRG